MFLLKLKGAGKRFQHEWIFRSLDIKLTLGQQLAITGNNGSGKSTLIKCIAGQMPLTEGDLTYFNGDHEVPASEFYQHIVISAPYLELPEEFTLKEFLDFHFKFKKISENISLNDFVDVLYLRQAIDKPISYFSSGMKQRLKLGICFFSEAPLILLDEPTSNLDERGIAWYLEMIQRQVGKKCILIASNDPREYGFCQNSIRMEDYKKKISL